MRGIIIIFRLSQFKRFLQYFVKKYQIQIKLYDFGVFKNFQASIEISILAVPLN
jgi:hypothetical protein